ncbi:MAG: hypothetical protein II165_04140, partial [Bacteroidales bacterium]|nr:hypothetical protein [Bacteroidales bacterium]
YVITDADAESINNKVERFSESINYIKSVNVAMVTVKGIANNAHSGIVHNVITAEDLFKA